MDRGAGQMTEEMLARIEGDARYVALIRQRTRLAWWLTAIIFAAFFSFIGLIAFDKELLGAPIGSGVTSLGIPVGFGLILFTILLTGLYVWRANGAFDRLTAAIVVEAEA